MSSSIIGVPTTRISDQFVRSRLIRQVQFDQRELFRLETQLSTGRRFERPGEDPVSAARIMSLQSLLERKKQVRSNLTTNQSYLGSTDVAMSQISNLMSEVRGAALAVVGTTATDQQRQAAALQVEQAVRQLLDAGNQSFRGRFLFAGSTTKVRPFNKVGQGVVEYSGNDAQLLSFADVDLLFETNVTGNNAFGAISEPVRGTMDFDPVLNYNTRLADLRGGEGISPGSIAVSDGTNTSIVDVSRAETIGDVAALIRANPPQGRLVQVEITPTGLKLQLDQAAAGDLSVLEVGGGTTADELGILTKVGVGLSPIEGRDLDPIVRSTTRLEDMFGARARAVVHTAGADNDLIVQADTRGTGLNGVSIHLNDDPTVSFGNEVVTYDPVAQRIDVAIDAGYTQAQHVMDAINSAHGAGVLPFTAELDPLDKEANPGLGLMTQTPAGESAGVTAYGSGEEFDAASGLQIVNGKQTYTISLASAKTMEDVLNVLNGSEAGVVAAINEDRTGIDVRSRLSGADFAIGENGGTTAAQLGIRTFTRDTRLAEMNHGFGVADYDGGGTPSEATFSFSGADNDLTLRALQNGPQYDGYTVDVIDSGGGAGSETVAWDPAAKTITIAVAPGVTTANRMIEVFDSTPGPRDAFEIALDATDGNPNTGQGLVELGQVTTSGASPGGIDFTITRSDGVAMEVDLAGATSIGDVLDQINNHPDNADGRLLARLAVEGNGIELVDDSIGTGQLQVARAHMSRAAIDLGLIPPGQRTMASTDPGTVAEVSVSSSGGDNDLVFRGIAPGTFANGVEVIFQDTGAESLTWDAGANQLRFDIDTAGGTDANRIIQLLAADPVASGLFTATLDPGDGNTGAGAVEATNPADPRVLSGGTPELLTGSDNAPAEVKGLFTALLRLEEALKSNDVPQVQRSIDLLDSGVLQLNFTRADLGAKQQGLDVLQSRLDAEEIDLREVLSEEHDVDIADVISKFTARQVALEAGMRATAEISRLTLLNYL